MGQDRNSLYKELLLHLLQDNHPWISSTIELSGKNARKCMWIEGLSVLGCDTVWLGEWFQMFWRYCEPLKFQESLTQSHSITSWLLNSTAVRNSGLTLCELLKECTWEVSFSPWSMLQLLHCSVHEQSVCDWSVIQSMKYVTAVHCSVHEQSVCDWSVVWSIDSLHVQCRVAPYW